MKTDKDSKYIYPNVVFVRNHRPKTRSYNVDTVRDIITHITDEQEKHNDTS